MDQSQSVLFALVLATASPSLLGVLADTAQQRMNAKPWIMKSIEIQEVDCLISPATILVAFVTLFYIYYACVLAAPKPSHVIASHILLKDHSDKTRDKLEAVKAKIGTDFDKFSKMAAKLSECPSKQNNGKLGRFKPGDMVPPFDKVVFCQSNPVRSTLGPIQTQFGWHLIYVEDRFLADKK